MLYTKVQSSIMPPWSKFSPTSAGNYSSLSHNLGGWGKGEVKEANGLEQKTSVFLWPLHQQ